MAVVRITGDLQQSVLQQVSNQFDAAERVAKALRPEIGQEVYDIVLKDFLADVKNVDPVYFIKIEKMDVHIRDLKTGDVREAWDLNSAQIAPQRLPDNSYNWKLSGYYSNATIEIRRDPAFDSIYQRVDAWQDALAQVKHDRNAAQHAVKKVLDSFATLAPALKAWPALWDLLPERIRERHREVVGRSKPEPVKIDINETHLEKLTSKLVVNRLMQKEDK